MATSLVTVSKDLVEARIAELQAQLEEEQEKLIELRPTEPEGDFAVIRFTKFGYTWAAIKTRTITGRYLWYVTQDGSRSARQGVTPKTWDDLIDWISDRNWEFIEVLS